MSDHWHCPSIGCYRRIQYGDSCSKCEKPKPDKTKPQAGCCSK